VTCYPQTYRWPYSSFAAASAVPDLMNEGNNLLGRSNRCYLALYSDSFTEALRDHRSGRIVASTGRPEQVIGNFLSNQETVEFLLYELKKNAYEVEVAAQDIAETQVHKFFMYNSYFGDNTSIILVDLGMTARGPDEQPLDEAAEEVTAEGQVEAEEEEEVGQEIADDKAITRSLEVVGEEEEEEVMSPDLLF
jgi:hypothetical protein